MTIPALPANRTLANGLTTKTSGLRRLSKRTKYSGLAAAVLTLGATLGVAIPADASVAKLNGLCTKSELGKRTTTLICSKSGTRYRWFKRKTTTSTSTSSGNNLGGTSESVTGLPGASSGSGPANIGLAVLPFGTIPAGATSKIDINCAGLPATPGTATQSLSFPGAGGSNQVTFTVSPPSTSNPTGSTCAAVATSSVAAKVTVLVDGTTVVGPVANTATSPAFTAVDGTKVTLLVDYSANAPAATLPPAPPVTAAPVVSPVTLAPLASSTTLAPTTTVSPLALVLPASGRVEIGTKLLTLSPAAFLGVTAEMLCSPGAAGQGYQSQTLRFDRASAILNPSVQLGAISPGFGGTACQVDFSLQGEGLAGTNLRLFLNGQIQTNTVTGTLIKSNSFDATKPFNLTVEIAFPGQAAVATSTAGSTGGITGTVTTATTTTTIATAVATQATVQLVRSATGNAAPANLANYPVTVSCTNAIVNGQTLASAEWLASFPTSGGIAPVSLGLTANSVCTTTVLSGAATGTAAITTGLMSLAIGGTVRGSGTNGSVTSGAIPPPTPFTVVVTINY